MDHAMFHLILCLFGLAMGSFLNVCIYRIPRNLSIVRPRSRCPLCSCQLSWWQNIPLLSFILLKRRCHHCKKLISWQYPFVEILSLIITLLLHEQYDLSQNFVLYLIFFYGLIIISTVDYQLHIIPNNILVFLLSAGIFVNLFFRTIPWIDAITGFLFSLSFMIVIRILGDLILLKESMGMGDIKLAAILGFYIGWQHFLWTLFLGSLLALLINLMYTNLTKTSIQPKIPFAPYLSFVAFLKILLDGFH